MAVFSSFVAGIGITLWTERVMLSAKSEAHVVPEVHSGQWKLINPLINCSVTRGRSPKEAPLEKQLRKTIAAYKTRMPVDQISVYYRDLNNGPSVEIDSDHNFVAASLMKVPVAIMYLRMAERAPELMKKKFTYHQGYAMPAHVQTVSVPDPMTIGQEYTVEELITRMLIRSDNVAAAILINEAQETDVVRVLEEMGIPMKIVGGSDASIAVEDYASIFRILYNATFLEKGSSNHLLELLAQTSHRGGIREGLKPEILVASKFGEYRIGTVQQYHECGIIYYPNRPYLLCVMTRGGEVPELQGAVREISTALFDFISNTQKKTK